MVFEAALQLPWRTFRREMPATVLLAFPDVVIGGALVALSTRFLLGWSWIGASLFDVLIAATDPVSVVAAFREIKVQSRLSLLVESESLLNNGAAAVGFAVVISLAAGHSATLIAIAGEFAWTIISGVVAAAVVSGLLLLIAGRTHDHLIEMTLTTIAAYGSFGSSPRHTQCPE